MTIYLKSGGLLREMLKPDVDFYTRKLETEAGKSVREILADIGINPALIAFLYIDGKLKHLDHQPEDGERITLQPPVSGG